MSQSFSAFILGPTPAFTEADEPKEPVTKLTTAYVIALSVVVLFGIAVAAWWAWFISRELAAVCAEGFHKIGMPEE
jgi:hypothetical protein